MKADQVQPRPRHQRRQPLHEPLPNGRTSEKPNQQAEAINRANFHDSRARVTPEHEIIQNRDFDGEEFCRFECELFHVKADQIEQDHNSGRSTSGLSARRQLAATIERALVDGQVSPEIRGQVRDMMAAEGARRIGRGERSKVSVYDIRAPRARSKILSPDPKRLSDRDRSR